MTTHFDRYKIIIISLFASKETPVRVLEDIFINIIGQLMRPKRKKIKIILQKVIKV